MNKINKVLPEYELGLSLFGLSPNPIALLQEGRYLDCNDALLELYGLDRKDELVGHALGKKFSPDRQPDGQDSSTGAIQFYTKCLEQGHASFEWVSQRLNGELIHSFMDLHRLDIVDPPLVVLFYRDYSEQFRTRQELLESEKRFQALTDHAPVGIFIGDMQGNWIYSNPKMQEICGLEADTMLGVGWSAHLHPDDKAKVFSDWGAFVTGKRPFSLEFRFLPNDNEELWVSTTAVPFTQNPDEPARFLGTATDITELIRIEQQLKYSRNEAQRANNAKSEFLSHMSHELRTPLNAILGFGQLLQLNNSELADEQREAVDQILVGGEHLLGLIEEILDLSKIESGQLALDMKAVETTRLLERTMSMVSALADQHGVEVQLPNEPMPDVMADPHRLQQVLVNLLSNAIKYNRPNGKVAIRCEILSDSRLRIHIIDNGRGIHPQFHSRLFKPFERFHSTSEIIEGTGIGLSLSQRLMHLMGGRIDFKSEPGKGSDFWIEFTRVAEAGASTAAEPATAEEVADHLPSGLRVLYIDNHVGSVRQMVEVSRQINSCELITAGNAIEGMGLARNLKPDLVLIDIDLEETDGIEAARLLKKDDRTREIPIIAVSVHPMQDAISEYAREFIDDFLIKPFNIPELLNAIGKSTANRAGTA